MVTSCHARSTDQPGTWYVWEVSSESESIKLLVRQAEHSTSGWGPFGERSPLGSWFCTSVFGNVPGTVPESVRIYGFKRSSSNLDRTPKTRDSVLLKSWYIFSMTLPSISTESSADLLLSFSRSRCVLWLVVLGSSCVSRFLSLVS